MQNALGLVARLDAIEKFFTKTLRFLNIIDEITTLVTRAQDALADPFEEAAKFAEGLQKTLDANPTLTKGTINDSLEVLGRSLQELNVRQKELEDEINSKQKAIDDEVKRLEARRAAEKKTLSRVSDGRLSEEQIETLVPPISRVNNEIERLEINKGRLEREREKITADLAKISDVLTQIEQRAESVEAGGDVSKDAFNIASAQITIDNATIGAGLPRFQTGGIVDQATLALIGEGGPEAVVPLANGTSIPVTLTGGGLAGGVGSTPVAGAGELSAFQIPGLDAYIQKLEAAKKKSQELGDTTSDVFQEMANKAAQTVGSGLVTALEGIINGTQSAEDAFKQLGLTVVNELKNMALAALQNSLFGQNGTFGGGGGTAGLVVGIGSALLQAFGEGGVMTSSGPMTLRRYAGGGIAGTPQLAMFGEGSTPEAFVPLPNGRSIPVSLGGGVGNSINASFSSAVTVNVDGGRGDVSDPEQARELGATVSRAVRAEFNELLRDATRPGGTLNPQGFSRN